MSPSSPRPIDEMGLLTVGGPVGRLTAFVRAFEGSSRQSQRRDLKAKPTGQKRQRQVVRVLDVAEMAKVSHVKAPASSSKVVSAKQPAAQIKLISFLERLHPWTTIKELKQKIHQIKGYHVHRQRLFLNNFELLNSETLDYYGLLCEQVKEGQLQQMLQRVRANLKITGPAKGPGQSLGQDISLEDSSNHIDKMVLLRLAPDLKKLSKLNAKNIQIKIQKGKPSEDMDQVSAWCNEQGGNSQSASPIKSPCSPAKLAVKGQERCRLVDQETISNCIELFASMQCPQELGDAIYQIEQGFIKGLNPKLSEDGTSGTYLLRGRQKDALAVFKPIDEEAFAPNNPRDHAGPFGSKTFRAGVLSGEACIREVAAYLLDHEGFSGVPPTTMIENSHKSFKRFKYRNFKIVTGCQDYHDMISSIIAPENQMQNHELRENQDACIESKTNPDIEGKSLRYHFDGVLKTNPDIAYENARFLKIGSLQSFIQSEGPIENFSSDLFSDDEIHKIAILDLRLLNLDRNECNILVQRSELPANFDADTSLNLSVMSHEVNSRVKKHSWKLVPIDHGLAIPDTLEVCSFDLVWLSYAQAEHSFSQRSLDYIRSIDIMEDIRMLEGTFKFRPQCLRNMRISATLLKKGAEAGLTLAQIGQILCRPDEDDEQPSLLEQMVRRARTCSNMMAQIQTQIKDSTLRMILPSHAPRSQVMTPRRYSKEDKLLINEESVDRLDSDESESEEFFPLHQRRITFQDLDDGSGLRHKETGDDCKALPNTQVVEGLNYKSHSNHAPRFLKDINGPEIQSLGLQDQAQDNTPSPVRRRGYSDFDKINLNQLKLNIKASLQKVCDKKINLKKHRIKGKRAPGKTLKQSKKEKSGKKLAGREPKRLLDISSRSSSSSEDDDEIIDQSMFKDFDFAQPSQSKSDPEPVIFLPNQIEAIEEFKRLRGVQVQPKVEEAIRPKESEKPVKFASALKNFAQKLERTQPRGRPKRIAKAGVQRRLQDNISKIKQKQCLNLRRTSSFAGIKITEVSDEERDSEKEGEDQQKPGPVSSTAAEAKDWEVSPKKSSQMTSLTLSQASNKSAGFWHKKPSLRHGSSRPSFNESQGDQLRYHQRRRHDIYSGNQTTYKQRRAKLNLERDLKWNGPHDEEFFRCFEQYLDDAIKKFLREEDSSVKGDGEPQLPQAGTSQYSSGGFLGTPEDHQGSYAKDFSSSRLLSNNNANTPNVNTFDYDIDSPNSTTVGHFEGGAESSQQKETQPIASRMNNSKSATPCISEGSRGTRSSS